MLQVPNKQTTKCLELADFIDNLPPEKFSMGSWGNWAEPRCICGWFLHNEGYINKDHWREAASRLGMDEAIASKMFSQNILPISTYEAARAIRHFAVTGEFNGW